MIKKWYRGHSVTHNALDNFGIIWLTDDPYYAKVYAEDGGTISVIYVDESKVSAADWYYNDNFDPYFPNDKSINEFKEEGHNGYYFMAGYNYEEFQCLALFDKSPIVKVEKYEDISEVKLNENDLKYILKEIVTQLNGDFNNKQDIINKVLTEINDYLTDFGLSCTINTKYDFSGYYKNCVAVYQYRSVMNNGKIRIALNLPLIMSHEDIDIDEQIEISMWHEVGHGIVQWIKSLRRKDTQAKTAIFKGKIVKDLRYILNNEEEVVEEFGEYQSNLANYSILNYFIRDYHEILKPE